jgi:hypothetical protein
MVQGQLRQIVHLTPISTIPRAKWTRDVTQVIDHLLCKHEALVQTPAPPKKKEKEIQAVHKGRKLKLLCRKDFVRFPICLPIHISSVHIHISLVTFLTFMLSLSLRYHNASRFSSSYMYLV